MKILANKVLLRRRSKSSASVANVQLIMNGRTDYKLRSQTYRHRELSSRTSMDFEEGYRNLRPAIQAYNERISWLQSEGFDEDLKPYLPSDLYTKAAIKEFWCDERSGVNKRIMANPTSEKSPILDFMQDANAGGGITDGLDELREKYYE
jgi:hypothetical protein